MGHGLSRRLAIATAAMGLAFAATALGGVQQLPAGQQVNNDVGAGIDPTRSAVEADVAGGAVTAGGPAVPWSIFRQVTTSHDQIFVRSFAGGAWTTRGAGTVGGRSSVSPPFSGSLNFDQSSDGEAPAIDFAGVGRTVPWATWYENTTGTGFGNDNVFASRFDQVQNKWVFAGQGRNTGGGSVPVPSLNIHTGQDAENPSVAGGSAADPTKPGPWITWQETSSTNGKDQIFVVKPQGPGQTNCDGAVPTGVADGTGHVPAVGGFCWQQVGFERGPTATDPSLNVDPARDGLEPDIAFTGTNDAVPWVVWYEAGSLPTAGLRNNELVFAAKGVADGAADGGFHWQVVGSGGTGTLDTNGANNHLGACSESATAETSCSLNKNAFVDAEDPRVAAGTMTPGTATVPWVVWDESLSGTDQIFVARLVGGTHFELANNGQPISLSSNPSTRADIAFSGNTPYVSWRENTGGSVDKGFLGHFVNAANPTFVLDASNLDIAPATQAGVRLPISSTCTANPFNVDGATCQGNTIGTPFFLSINGTGSPLALFAGAYQPDAPVTGPPSAITATSAQLSASVNPEGGPVQVAFEFGPTTAYGSSTTPQRLAPGNAATPFTASLVGLTPATTVHYRAVATTDFGTFAGADQTLTTTPVTTTTTPPDTTPPHVKLKLHKTTRRKLALGKALKVGVTIDEPGSVTTSCSFKGKLGRKHRHGTLTKARSLTFALAGTKTLSFKPSKSARRLLKRLRKVTVTCQASAKDTAGNRSTARASLKLR